MAHLKICPVCNGKHRKRSAFMRCVRRNKPEKWSLKEA